MRTNCGIAALLFAFSSLAAGEEAAKAPTPPNGYASWRMFSFECHAIPGKRIVGTLYGKKNVVGLTKAYGKVDVNGRTITEAEGLFLGSFPLSVEVYVRDKNDLWTKFDVWVPGDKDKVGPRLLSEAGITEEEWKRCPKLELPKS